MKISGRYLLALAIVALCGCANQSQSEQAKHAPSTKASFVASPRVKAMEVKSVLLSPDRHWMVIGAMVDDIGRKGEITLRYARTWLVARHWPIDHGVQHFDFSPDSKLLSVSGYDRIYLHEIPSGKLLHTVPLSKETDRFRVSSDFSPDGKTLVVISLGGNFIVDVSTGKRKEIPANWRFGGFIKQATYSPNGKYLLTGEYDGTAMTLRDLTNGKQLIADSGDGGNFIFSKDGKLIAGSARYRSIGFGLQIWDIATRKILRKIPFDVKGDEIKGFKEPLEFSPNSKLLAVYSESGIEIWDVRSWKRLRSIQTKKTGVTWSGAKELTIYDEKGMQVVKL